MAVNVKLNMPLGSGGCDERVIFSGKCLAKDLIGVVVVPAPPLCHLRYKGCASSLDLRYGVLSQCRADFTYFERNCICRHRMWFTGAMYSETHGKRRA